MNPNEHNRLKRKELHRVKSLQKTLDGDSYLEECRNMCIRSGFCDNAVRHTVWRHVVLGLGILRPVPYVEDAVAQLSSSPINRRESGSGTGSDDGSGGSSNSGSDSSNSGSINKSSSANSLNEADEDSPQLSRITSTEESSTLYHRNLPDNCQPRVVHVDVQRSLWMLYPDASKRDSMREVLTSILLRVLASNTERYYYQGLHELMGFVMYVMEGTAVDVMLSVCEGLLLLHWRSFSDKQLSQSQSMLYAMHAVIAAEDASFAAALESCGVAPESHYAVSWLITWYVHVCEDVDILARLFDFFIGHSDEHAVIFFTAALVLHERDRILTWIDSAREGLEKGDDDIMVMARIYTQLTRLPKDVLRTENRAVVEEMMRVAIGLQSKYGLYVYKAREDFLQGRVAKLGMLTDKRTRNSALKLLWGLLFREWRKPWRSRNIKTPLVATVLIVVVAVTIRSLTASSMVRFWQTGYPSLT
ncbi:GTPase activating protein of Rab-like GTPase [Trypanosoma theileri]|uniref:GTPase activating protein of Rab-like GTPase n=1 Tax=Trypanosoma theileri TaxID=67003 RepID=A0A1X0NWK0_9TRYP|nr:GTPase activating protein of Rab-like GTPase [Trypanosoma theileri]ORC88918.1 GTPase activating protein of Rab-like GTPase [Trypanosoma theileri]